MNVAKARILAVVLALLQLAPLLPVAEASHLAPPLPDGLPTLPRAEPTSTCVGLTLPAETLARLQDPRGFGFREKEGVPALCSLDGRPMDDWQSAIRQLDAFLENYRNVTAELERQYEERLEYAVPEGPCVPQDGVGETLPYACPLLRPQVTLLSDRFDGRRLGGFGEWTVVTDGDAAPAWREAVTVTNNGTQHTWRFGADEGYARGAHQWLVSPQMDLGAVRSDPDLAQLLVLTHATARDTLRGTCLAEGPGSPVASVLRSLCGQGDARPAVEMLAESYEKAIDDYTRGLAVGQHAATLSLTFRMNLADREDGVRVWAWAGQEPPTRVQLYDLQSFGREETRLTCVRDPLATYTRTLPLGDYGEAACHEVAPETGAAFLLAERGLPSLPTRAFQTLAVAEQPLALTGDVRDFVTVDVPLSEFAGQRVWLLFEVATTPDAGRGDDYFGDRARFPRQDDYGFELASVHAVGDAWPRNVRLNDVSSAYTRMPVPNPYGDGRNVRTALPPGEDVVARVHNAGGFVENATLTLSFRENDHEGSVPVGGFVKLRDETLRVPNLRPGETREIRVPWPKDLEEDGLYGVSANLTTDDVRQLPPLSNTSAYVQPNATGVRPPNRAEQDGNATAHLLLRAYTDHRLSPQHYPAGQRGPALEVCESVSSLTGCKPLYVAGKGERRTLLLGVRNDGSVPEDASAVLDLRLDGVDKSAAIQGGAVRELRDLLPGETRPVQWELAPADAGAYKATVYLRLANGTVVGEPVTRLVFVQRSTGLICFDDLAENRECGASFASARVDGLRNETVTASAVDADGVLYVTTTTTLDTGALWAHEPDGAWTMMENLSIQALDNVLPRLRPDLGFGAIRDVHVDDDGTLWLAGDNGTLLARGPTGGLRAIPYPVEGAGALVAHAGAAAYQVEAGSPLTLTGSIVGGAGGYAHVWSVAPAATFTTPERLTTDLVATTPGSYVVGLTATDAQGATAWHNVTVLVKEPTPACVKSGASVLYSTLLGTDPVDAGPGAADLRCATAQDTGADRTGQVLVGIHPRNLTDAQGKTVTYEVSFTSQGVAFRGSFTWDGATASAVAVSPPSFSASVDKAQDHFVLRFGKTGALLVSESFALEGLTVSATVDGVTDAISGRYSLATDVAPPGVPSGLRAAAHLERGDAVQVAWTPLAGAESYVVERAVAGGGFAILGETPNAAFEDTRVEVDRPHLYRVRAVDADGDWGDPSAVVEGTPRAPSAHHLSVARWNGTLFVGSELGRAWWLNESTGALEEFTLNLTRGASAGTPIVNPVRDLLASPDGKRLYAAAGGNVFLNEGKGAAWRSNGWVEAFTPYPHAYDLTSLTVHAGTVYAGGRGPDGGVLLVSNRTDGFRHAQAPEVAGRSANVTGLASAPDGRLFAVTTDATAPLAACSPCGTAAEWTFPAVPLPSLLQNGVARRANVVDLAGGAGRVVALAEGGVVLEYARRGEYANDEDWSVQPALRVNDGTAYEFSMKGDTTTTLDAILRFEPLDAAAQTLEWTRLRITADHHLAYVGSTPSSSVRIRAFYLPFPNVNPSPGVGTPPEGTCAFNCIENTQGVVGAERILTEPSDAGGWERTVFTLEKPREANTGLETRAAFSGVEFFVQRGTSPKWAVDDVVVEAYVPGQGWVELLSWHGPARSNAKLVPYTTAGARGEPWREVTQPFGFDTVSAWHLSQDLADRPVWVLNNEVYPGEAGGSAPRLLADWDTRLLSPVIDLSEAYDPIVTFRHAYAFKTRIFKTDDRTAVEPGDGGWVEVQYEKRGEECGEGLAPETRCWSSFYTVCPDQPDDADLDPPTFPALKGYCKAGTGYPRMKDLGFASAELEYGVRARDPYNHAVGPDNVGATSPFQPAASFWGRTVLPDPTGVISGVRDTTRYEDVQITLSKQLIHDEDGNPVDLAGRRIRVGFHGLTAVSGETKWDYKSADQVQGATSYPGEGWYVTDFKVRGATQLGVDLRATNMTFEVGYEWVTLGVGPGTRVPINVTIENRGRFEAAGYTGVLEARRVVDAALGITELVGEYPLPQQPALLPERSRNHTLMWPVPDEEGARYVLTFTAKPIGIARDEDFTDNVGRIGSVTSPVPAQTRPGYAARVAISPADATKDITRYVAITLDNTGNVVLGESAGGEQAYFRVTRRILQLGTQETDAAKDCDAWREQVRLTGRTGPLVDCRTWNTSVPVHFGTEASLASVSNEFNPATDLFWKPPTSADYRVLVSVELLSRPASQAPSPADAPVGIPGTSAERIARSFDTYLFDDAELGPRGFAIKGEWEFEPGWGEHEPGFRSSRSYGVGDAVLLRFTADVDTSLVTPTVDLGTARSARFAIYHRYKFEPGYDGGVIEASVDGGRTWSRLTPIDQDLNGKYDADHPMAATSPLHLTGDPRDKTLAFTGDSAALPQASDGWVLSVFDLTDYPEIAQEDVPYELFDSAALSNYENNGTKDDGALRTYPTATNATYFDQTWNVGRVDEYRYWEQHNLTEDALRPRGAADGEGAPDTFWWSGSNTLQDDMLRPVENTWLTINVSDALAGVQEGDRVVVEWWEWLDRTRMGVSSRYANNPKQPDDLRPDPRETRGVFVWNDHATTPQNYHVNLTAPNVLARNGSWMLLQSDITDWVRQEKTLGPIGEISFVYTPVLKAPAYTPADPAKAADVARDANETTRYSERYLDDRGFVIDEFTIKASKVVGGQEYDVRVLMDEDAAWDRAAIQRCGRDAQGNPEPDHGTNWAWLPCTHNNGQGNTKLIGGPNLPRLPAEPAWGRTWVRSTYVPGVSAQWQVVSVQDANGKRSDRLPATGETPSAWYTGPVCAGQPSDPYYTYDPRLCLLPGEESRLVTPAFDLSTIAGTTADLTFTHRYGFHLDPIDGGRHPFASGGVVEIQVFDEQANKWGPWKQLYADPDAIYYEKGDANWSDEGLVARLGPANDKGVALGQDRHGPLRGGYSAYTVNETSDSGGRMLRRDAPFDPIRHYDPETRAFTDVQFLYSGRSSDVTGEPDNGWVPARFPLTEYLGKTVRVGFHVSASGLNRALQSAPASSLHNPDGVLAGPGGEDYYRSGWWIMDVGIVGKVLHGAPVQLRARAATDGNVHDGVWQIDDVGIFGSHYGENVGVFYDREARHGGMAGRTVTVPVTIRNLGEAVRENLAIDVRELSSGGKSLTLAGHHLEKNAARLPENPDVLRLSGYTLAPGQSVVALVNVTVAEELDEASDVELLVELKQYNPLERKFQTIPFNEVQGFLKLRIPFEVERFPTVTLTKPRSLNATIAAGGVLDVAVDARNEGFETVQLNVTCEATLVDGHEAQDHRATGIEKPVVAAVVPCALVGGATTLAPGANSTLTYRLHPPRDGALLLRFDGKVNATGTLGDVDAPATLTTLVGRSPLLYAEGFDDERTVLTNWTADASAGGDGSAPPEWSYARGRDKPGSLLLGINESLTSAMSYNARCSNVCRAYTRPFDLHNYSEEDVQLSFWHMDRLARHDGAQVTWQALLDERRPNLADSWSDAHCILYPRGGYDRSPPVISLYPQAETDPEEDSIPYAPWRGLDGTSPANKDARAAFFTSDGFDDAWSLATFDLREQDPCKADPAKPNEAYTPLGHTVRFVISVYAGPKTESEALKRGMGHGLLVDDVSLSLSRLTLRPEGAQRALLLDNTTKGFHLVLGNLASQPDLVRLEVDEGNSSAPAGSIVVPRDPVAVPARTEGQLVRVDVQLPRDPSLLPTQFRARIVARSVLDPTASAAADFILDFQPRQWAELGVSVAPPGLAVQEGTETFLPVTVENNGVVASTPTVVRVTDAWEGGVQVMDVDLPSMPSYFQDAEDALRVLEFRWRPQKGSIGMHTLTFEVDPDRLGEEYTRVNNVLTLRVPVAELLLPDVDVAAPDALRLRNAVGQSLEPLKEGGVTRYESAAGELVTLEVKVRNPGRAAATNVDVRAFIGPLSLPAKTVPYVGPGEEVSLTFNWVAQKGEYPIEVVARSELVETNAANNRNPAQGVNILVVKGFEVKVALPELDGVLEPGTEVKLPFNVTNVGNAGEDVRLAPRVPDGWDASVARESLFLRPGETFTTTLTVVVPAHAVAGQHFISVDAIARSNPMKAATASVPAVVRAFYGGTLDATVAVGAPPVVRVPLTLTNDGNSVEPWTVTLTLPVGWTLVDAQPVRVVVPPRGSLDLDLRVRMPDATPPGERLVGARATLPDGSRLDAVVRLDVRELRAATAVVADDRPREAQGALAYAVLVQNAGNVARPFNLVLLGVPEGIEAKVEPSVFTLQPGAKAVATLRVTPQAGVATGAHQIEAFASFEGVPPDTPEGRKNHQRLQVSVVRPDLRAGQMDYAKAGVESGERVVVKVPIHNEGQGTTSDLPVHLFVDDVFMGEVRVARLAPGEKRDVTLNWTAKPGQHTVTAVVDPWKDTVDADARDNAVSALVRVESGPVSGLVGGARVPAGGFVLALLAALAAALVATPLVGARRPPR